METAENESIQRNVFERLSAGRRSFTLRMVPLIDMVFLLLIFFLVSGKWRPEENFLPLQLAAAQGQSCNTGRPESLAIHISAAETGCWVQIDHFHTVRIEGERIEQDLTELMEEMKKCMLAQKRFATDPIEIVCGPEVRWEYLAKIYNVFVGAGMTDITFTMTE